MTILSAVLQVTGLLVVALGVGLIYPPAGLVVVGLGAFAIGFAIDPPRRAK